MSRITGIGGTGIANLPKAAAHTPASGFSVEADNPAPVVQENQPAQNVVLSSMLALQEAETETIQDKTARRHGISLLKTLSELQKALLSGLGDNKAEVKTLTLLTLNMPTVADPELAAALDAIRLRAKIELLRRGVEIT